MTFKLYDDKSSVLKKNTRYVQGGTTEIFPNRLGLWEKRTDIERDAITDGEFTITARYARRPDRIAYAYYQRNDLQWLILQYNNIVDINTEFVTGRLIYLPSPLRVFSEILTNPIKYQPK